MSKSERVQRERDTQPEARVKRTKRIPISQQASVLAVAEVPEGKMGRWVNDINNGSRLHAMKLAGYEFVTSGGITSVEHEAGNVVCRNVGQGITSYLMVIDKELYDEDQWAKEEKLLEIDAAMRRNTERDRFYGKVETKVTKGKELG